MELMETIARRTEVAKAQAVRQRNYRRARDRALARLSRDYPNVYRTYLEEEMNVDEDMGKKWLDIAGNTKPRNFRRG
jgi:DNA polymerase/3'-5' exonuclease PolX